MSLQGQIEEMGLGPVIQTLSLNRYRGTLRIETEDGGSQFFFISEGEIVLVRQVARDPVRLGELLVYSGKITTQDLEDALAKQKGSGRRLGSVMVDIGLITQEGIDGVIREKFEHEFLDMFLLDRGRFEFIFGLTPEALFAPEEKLERISLNTESLMFEAMRQVDEWQDMIQSVGSLDTIYANRMKSMGVQVGDYEFEGVELSPQARSELYELLDGTRSLREVLGEAIRLGTATRLETFKFLHHLRKNDLVKPLDAKTLVGEARRALKEKNVPHAAKYIRAVLSRKGTIELGLVKRYLEFLRKNDRPKLAFTEARTFAGRCLAQGETKQAISLYEEAVALEFRDAEVVDRLFYALLRDNQRERAVQVGLLLRDYLGSDANVQVATRVVRNLKELVADHPEVLELSGLIAMQREQSEVARRELDLALARTAENHPRRRFIIEALLRLDPEREDLRAEVETQEVRDARVQLQREFRLRLGTYVLIPLICVAGVAAYLAYGEWKAGQALERAKELFATSTEDFDKVYEAANLIPLAVASWTSSEEAQALKLEIDARIRERDNARRDELDGLIRMQKADDQARREREERERLARELEGRRVEYRTLADSREYAAASRLALELIARAREAGVEPPEGLQVFVSVESVPASAQVYVNGQRFGETPTAVGVTPGETTDLQLRRSGFRVQEDRVTPAGFTERRYTLEPGPSWSVDLGERPLPPSPSPQRVLVATGSGSLRALDLSNGETQWELNVLDDLERADRPRPSFLEAAVSCGEAAVAVCGDTVVSYSLAGGDPLATHAFPAGGSFLPPVVAEVHGQPVVVLCRDRTLIVLQPRTGRVLQETELPGKILQPPATGSDQAFVATKGGVLFAVSLKQPDPKQALLWRAEIGLDAAAPPIHSARTEAVVVRGAESLVVVGTLDGSLVAVLRPELGPLQEATVVEDRVYVLSTQSVLVGLGIYDGSQVLPAMRIGARISGGPILLGRDIALVDGQGQLLRFGRNGSTREEVKFQLDGPLTSPLAVVKGMDRAVAVCGTRLLLIESIEDR
ncbi:MAG: PQQ-binding-like beta-propeller repeat protein [Planctomycetota bacterium]